MRTNLLCGLLLVGATMTTLLAAQVGPESRSREFHLNLTATYSSARYSQVKGNGFWLQGTSMQAEARLGDHLGLVGDARGLHSARIGSSSAGLDLITATAGPRFTFRQSKMSLFGQVLAGKAMAFNGLFPHPSHFETSASCFALLAGGGVDMMLSRRVKLRAVEANWMDTHLPNGTNNQQSAFLLGAGISYWFK